MHLMPSSSFFTPLQKTTEEGGSRGVHGLILADCRLNTPLARDRPGTDMQQDHRWSAPQAGVAGPGVSVRCFPMSTQAIRTAQCRIEAQDDDLQQTSCTPRRGGLQLLRSRAVGAHGLILPASCGGIEQVRCLDQHLICVHFGLVL